MKIYQVGGSIRDEVLGIEAKDFDYVVVGATVAEFKDKYPEAELVGKSFPVFIVDGDEYAFARIERKIGVGHCGFDVDYEPTVTIEEDLMRRDLTINAIARDVETGEVVYVDGAYEDIKSGVLRHVSDAFCEDPLRVYRLARFAAKFPEFVVCDKTKKLCEGMKRELSHLPTERVFAELCKALNCEMPSRFFTVLDECGVLDVHFSEIVKMKIIPAGPIEHHPEGDLFSHTMQVVDGTVKDSVARFGALVHDFGKLVTDSNNYPCHYRHDSEGVFSSVVMAFCDKFKVGVEYSRMATFCARHHMRVGKFFEMKPGKLVSMFEYMSRFVIDSDKFLSVVNADGQNVCKKAFDCCLKSVMMVKLPVEYHDRGTKCKDILMNLRCHKLNNCRNFYSK